MDFIVLDNQPLLQVSIQIPIILGHPLFATSNALINYRNGIIKLSFGNMTLELNMFDIAKQSREEEDSQEVNYIESLTQSLFEKT